MNKKEKKSGKTPFLSRNKSQVVIGAPLEKYSLSAR